MSRALILWLLAQLLITPTVTAETPPRITVFAAASLTHTLQKVSQAFRHESGIEVRHSFAASSTIARQIENGARADVILSADQAWMDYLEQRSLIKPHTRYTLLGNRLVLIAPTPRRPHTQAVSAPPIRRIDTPEQLRALLTPLQDPRARLTVADPVGVPLGRYSRAALETLNTWNTVRSRLALADNARSALMLVARGESPLGIVYATDARHEDQVVVLGVFDQGLYPVIAYPIAATIHASNHTTRYLDFLRSTSAKEIFRQDGFLTPDVSAPARP